MRLTVLTTLTVIYLAGLLAALPLICPSDADRAALAAKERDCLAKAVYFEARGEPYMGQLAVALVIANRMQDRRYPDSACGVVYQNATRRNACQFSFACDGRSDTPRDPASWARAQGVADMVLSRTLRDLTDAATHYHADYVAPRWASHLQRTQTIGRHVFYRTNQKT
ncbi:cell wall hydrolase [Oceanibacterium hippocampi]|uniref:Spore cortex-lytic enzyme n=1 Tax=Oceanibacterium hippocampi TaxID=745714 RepID=A0A1Y5U1P5_9PROT|nr:cell wall hydrolase [Oceanibacterium hippocampi]SLN76881.1 Spore cortex-lytic enzyme precursor [Oceanibacterium hippocampi]